MTCVLVGTDRLGAAPRILKEQYGATEIIHWSGRKKVPKNIPRKTNLIIVYSSFISHEYMWAIKRLAKIHNIKIIFVNRGLSDLANRTEIGA